MGGNFSSLTERSNINELADLFEVYAIKYGQISRIDIERYLGILSDNDENEGIDDNDSERANKLDDVIGILEERQRILSGKYSFKIDETGNILSCIFDETNHFHWCYLYLLLSTNTNMRDNKILNEVDGTLLLEEISAKVLKNYLGSHAKSFVFGTAATGGFEAKINHLCQEVGEGIRYRDDRTTHYDRDGKLDTVGWIPFSDRKPSKLIVFGQCKTGTNWKDTLSQLQPDTFMSKFLYRPFALMPVRSFFISDAVESVRWEDVVIDGGLFFDRCRIVEFCPEELEADLFLKIRRWTEEAIRIVDI
jgi:hypothetical protein